MVSGFCRRRCAGRPSAARPLPEAARRREERRLEPPPVDPVGVVDKVVPLEVPPVRICRRRRLRPGQAEGAAGGTYVNTG